MPLNNTTTGPKRQLPPPDTSFSWTKKLVVRDLKCRCKETKTKISNVFKKILPTRRHTTEMGQPAPTIQPPPVPPARSPRGANTHEITNVGLRSQNSQHFQKPSVSTTITTTTATMASSTHPGTTSSPVTRATTPDLPPIPPLPFRAPDFESLYDMMQNKLRNWRNLRPFGLTHEARWKNRGMTILLVNLLELCSSNKCYDKLRDGQPAPDQADFVVGVLKLAAQYEDSPIELFSGHISSMDADTGKRFDSVVQPNPIAPPSPMQLWAALMITLDNRSWTFDVLEALLLEILPDLDVEIFLVRLGDPAWVLKDAEDDMMREEFRNILFPEYHALGIPRVSCC